MTRRDRDLLDIEISERQRLRARAFDLCDTRPDYLPVKGPRPDAPPMLSLSKTALQFSAFDLGPSFIYILYVAPTAILYARNIVIECMAHAKNNPFSPYINIVETPDFDEGEWCLEANDKRVGSNFPW